MIHEMIKGPSKQDHIKYRGWEAVSETMQLGIVTANAMAMSNTVSSSFPANQNLCEVLMWPNDPIPPRREIRPARRNDCNPDKQHRDLADSTDYAMAVSHRRDATHG